MPEPRSLIPRHDARCKSLFVLRMFVDRSCQTALRWPRAFGERLAQKRRSLMSCNRLSLVRPPSRQFAGASEFGSEREKTVRPPFKSSRKTHVSKLRNKFLRIHSGHWVDVRPRWGQSHQHVAHHPDAGSVDLPGGSASRHG